MTKFLFLLIAASSAVSAEAITSFDQALFTAEKLEENTAYKTHMYESILPEFSERYSVILQDCIKSIELPDWSKFNMILELDKEGKITKVFRNKETNIGMCMINRLENDKLAAPLISPFYINIAMSFK